MEPEENFILEVVYLHYINTGNNISLNNFREQYLNNKCILTDLLNDYDPYAFCDLLNGLLPKEGFITQSDGAKWPEILNQNEIYTRNEGGYGASYIYFEHKGSYFRFKSFESSSWEEDYVDIWDVKRNLKQVEKQIKEVVTFE